MRERIECRLEPPFVNKYGSKDISMSVKGVEQFRGHNT